MIYSTERICQAALAEARFGVHHINTKEHPVRCPAVTHSDLEYDSTERLEGAWVDLQVWVSAGAIQDRLTGKWLDTSGTGVQAECADPAPQSHIEPGLGEVAEAVVAMEAALKTLQKCLNC